VPANPRRQRHPSHTCHPGLSHRCVTSRACRSTPAHTLTASPAMPPCRAHQALPAVPDQVLNSWPCYTFRPLPSAPSHTCQAEPCPVSPQQAMPATPCLSLARPRLARHALPRSASPTSPNQQRQASASTGAHALPARPDLAVPSEAMPATPSHFNPDQSSPCLPIHSLPAWPFRPDRAMPAPPGLARPGYSFRTMPAKPWNTARCLAQAMAAVATMAP
jgi:hypothetical protein